MGEHHSRLLKGSRPPADFPAPKGAAERTAPRLWGQAPGRSPVLSERSTSHLYKGVSLPPRKASGGDKGTAQCRWSLEVK